jgi:predicted nucleic acid-binding protein
VILADTSAWVEFLRATGSATDRRLEALLAEGEVGTTDVVLMEVLAGARNSAEWRELRRLLGRCAFLPVHGPADYEAAAHLYRRCRREGETIRKLTDCLIAVVAMAADAELLHRDADFVAIAGHGPLRVA